MKVSEAETELRLIRLDIAEVQVTGQEPKHALCAVRPGPRTKADCDLLLIRKQLGK